MRNAESLCSAVSDAVYEAISDLTGMPEAGEIVKMGADGTPTDRIDEVAENAAVEVLESDGRSMRIVSEELGEKTIGSSPEFTVVLDPVDGTFNAVNAIPFYCVSIALAQNSLSDIFYGYVRDLYTNTTYKAAKGKGAYFERQKLHVSSISDTSELSIIFYNHCNTFSPAKISTMNVRRIRSFGSAAMELCYVASGKFDAFIDLRNKLRVTDIAAAKLIVEESYGKITDENMKSHSTPLDVRLRVNIIASNGSLHNEVSAKYFSEDCY